MKDLFLFTKRVEEFDPNLVMANFSNILLIKTISLCVKNLRQILKVYQKVIFVVIRNDNG